MIPKEVMLQAQQEFLNFNETGISVMEMSHRSKEYLPIVEKAEKSLRTLLKIPNNYKVLFFTRRCDYSKLHGPNEFT